MARLINISKNLEQVNIFFKRNKLDIIAHDNHNRLARRLLFYVVLCSAGFTLIATVGQLFWEYDSDVDTIHKTMNYIENSYVPNIALSIYLVEDEQIKILLKGALHFRDIQYLEIQEKRGKKIVKTFAGKADAPRDIVKEYQIKYPSPSGENISYGVLIVAASLEEVYQRLLNKSLIILATNAIKTFFASMCIFFIIQFIITRHLKTISKYTQTLDLDKIGLQLNLNRKEPSKMDELSQVVLSINTMQEKLKIDITERKQAEKKQKKLQAQLTQAQKMESIGTLAGGIAHDFNNLLYPIIGFSEMLKEDLPPDSPEYESAQEIFNAGRRGGELVKQILAFSRQTEHKLSPVRFQKILTEVCKLTRSTIPSDIEIYLDIQKDCGLVMAEATQLHQIAMNLITNAYHAVEKASGKISIQLKEIMLNNDDLKDSPLQSGQYVMLSVSDNGVGIPREMMNNIFEPYFTTKEKGKGTGLGLAVVHGIVKEHKGDIKVYSEDGKGTTFNVYLPLMNKSTEPISTEKELNKLTGTERILLVDDEESIVRLEKQMLERLGYNVSVRSDSLEALETFNSNPDNYDLVITDMTMPKITGDKLAQELMSIRPDIPIIICTGFSERINKEQAEANKVKGFLMKPVIKSEMAQMVRKVLDDAKVYKGN